MLSFSVTYKCKKFFLLLLFTKAFRFPSSKKIVVKTWDPNGFLSETSFVLLNRYFFQELVEI